MANASGIRAGRAFVELFADDSKLAKGLSVASARLKSWGDGITALGGKLFALGSIATLPFVGAAKIFAGLEGQMVGLDNRGAGALIASFNLLKQSLTLIAAVVGGAVAPVLSVLMVRASAIAQSFALWLRQNQGLVLSAFQLAVGVAALGAGLVVVGKVMTGLSAVFTVAKFALVAFGAGLKLGLAALTALLSPIGLVVAAVGGVVAAFLFLTEQGENTRSALADAWDNITSTTSAAWKGIIDAVKAGDLALAAKIAWAGLKAVWAAGLDALSTAWIEFKDFLLGIWSTAVFKIADLMNTMWTNLQTNWAGTLGILELGWTNFITGLKLSWLNFSGFFEKVWARIKSLFSGEDAQTAIDRINSEIEAENNAIVDQRDKRREAIGAAYNERRDALAKEQEAIRANLAEQFQQEKDARQKDKDNKLANAAAEFDKAKEDLDNLTTEAAQKREAVAKKTAAAGPLALSKFGESTGTFSGAVALRQAGAGGVQERQLDILQQLLKVNEDQLRQQRKDSPQFS